MNRCEEYQELISRLLDGELSSEEQTALDAHIAVCPDCAAVCAAFHALSEALSSDLVEPPEALHENIMANIRRENIKKQNRPTRRWRSLLAVAACFAVIVLAAANVPRLLHGMGSPASSQSSSSSAPAAVQGMADAASAEDDFVPFSTAATAESAEGESIARDDEDCLDLANQNLADNAAFVLTEGKQSEVFLELLRGEEASLPIGAPDRQVSVSYVLDGVRYEVILLLYGDRVYYAPYGGDGQIRLSDAGADEILALFP